MSAVDKSSMGRFMSSEGTDAATSNVIAGAVSDVWRAHFGNEWVPFSVRYGIAHEVQRRLAQRSGEPSPCAGCGGDGVQIDDDPESTRQIVSTCGECRSSGSGDPS